MPTTTMTTKSTINSGTDVNEYLYDNNNYIKVIWEDTQDNHSSVKEKEVEKYFQNKYKTHKVKVIFKPILNKNSDMVVEGTADASELILDENYQKQLIEQFVKENKVNIHLPHLMKLDGSVNMELENYKEQTNRYKTFKILEIEFSNFLSYGANNVLVLDNGGGITSVISDPANYGGKTTLTVDLLLFLFFGTTTKSDKMEEVFNKFTTEDSVEVKGKVVIEGDTYIIKRRLSRKKSKNDYKYESQVDFFQVMPRGGIKQLNGEQGRFTNELIKTYVGSFDDFLITILTTGDNLDDLIKTKPTERGRILTRFIGLEFFREKEKIAKKKYTEWKEKSKLYHNSSQDINNNIEAENKKIEENQLMIYTQRNSYETLKNEIVTLEAERERLFTTRFNDIDTELYKTDESAILQGLETITKRIADKKAEITKLEEEVPEPDVEYDIDRYGMVAGNLKEDTEKEISFRLEIIGDKQKLDNLKNSEICQSCKRPLDGVDFKQEIKETEETLVKLNENWEAVKKSIEVNTAELNNLNTIKNKWDAFNKNILLIDKSRVELKAFEDSLGRGNEKLDKYHKCKENVEKNKLTDTEIQTLKFKIDSLNEQKDMVALQIKGLEKDVELSNKKIADSQGLIKELKSEEAVDNIFKTYLDVYGKNGISKMVLGTMIPLINSHLRMLLSDSSEFNLEIRMDDKGDVKFWMIDIESGVEKLIDSGSGYEKTISSLALRCVLSKVCSLPKPNIIVFDEITGKVSNDNLEKIGLFFEKLKQFFEHIWIISHNPLVQDWADHLVMVKKEGNISRVITE